MIDWTLPVRWKCDHSPVEVHAVRNMLGGKVATISWVDGLGNWIVSTAFSDDKRFENLPTITEDFK